MNELVFIEPNKIDSMPFTTSGIIAEYAKVKRETVMRLIRNHESDLEVFGRVGFEIRTLQTRGGLQQIKEYMLNEPQATLLITFLKNTEPVIKFKTELVRQFYAMREELMNRRMLRQQLRPIRRELTDVIQDKPDHSRWDFKLYTDLAYKTTLGMNAAQLRKARGAAKIAVAIDYMTADEIQRVSKAQSQIAVLLEMGMNYQQVKGVMLNRQMVGNIA